MFVDIQTNSVYTQRGEKRDTKAQPIACLLLVVCCGTLNVLSDDIHKLGRMLSTNLLP
jgi:hypothetical protein